MPSTEALFLGDMHLNSLELLFPDYATPNDFIFETYEQPLAYARENGIKTIVLLGDIFDDPEPDQKSQAAFFHWLYKNSDLNFEIIFGNHDAEIAEDGTLTGRFSLETTNFLTRLKLLPHVHLYLTKTETKINGVPFTFMSWPEHKRKGKYATLNVAHVPRVGAKSDSGRVFKAGEGYELDTSRGDFWIVGDLHQHQKLDRCIYPGMLYQKTFGEKLPKGFLHAEITSKKDGSIHVNSKWVPVEPAFKLINLKVETMADLKQIEKYSLKVRYKLFLGREIGSLPANFLEANPHVVKWDKTSRLRVLESMGEETSIKITNIEELDVDELIYDSLGPFLEKEGLSTKQIKRARNIIGSIRQRIEVR